MKRQVDIRIIQLNAGARQHSADRAISPTYTYKVLWLDLQVS
jgi:hypothetical protein